EALGQFAGLVEGAVVDDHDLEAVRQRVEVGEGVCQRLLFVVSRDDNEIFHGSFLPSPLVGEGRMGQLSSRYTASVSAAHFSQLNSFTHAKPLPRSSSRSLMSSKTRASAAANASGSRASAVSPAGP